MSKQKSKFSIWKKIGITPIIAGASLLIIQFVNAETSKEFEEVTNSLKKLTTPAEVIVTQTPVLEQDKPTQTIEEPKVSDTIKKKKGEAVPVLPTTPEKQKVEENDVYETVEEGAKPLLEGGMGGIRRRFQEMFNTEKMEGKGRIKTEVTFVVETDGSISNVTAKGDNQVFNDESAKAMTLASEGVKWQPGKKDGKEVRSRFRFPLTMQFE